MKNSIFYQRIQTLADIWGKLYLFHPCMIEKGFSPEELFLETLAHITEDLSSTQWQED